MSMYKLQIDTLIEYLYKVDKTFPVSLSQKVNLEEYARKLLEKATLCFEIWDKELVGLVAGYTDNMVNGIAYIALVGVVEKAQHKGIASKLIKQFCYECNKKKIDKVHLYTDSSNDVAINMYKKLGFETYVVHDEPRPDDVHLILSIKNLEV